MVVRHVEDVVVELSATNVLTKSSTGCPTLRVIFCVIGMAVRAGVELQKTGAIGVPGMVMKPPMSYNGASTVNCVVVWISLRKIRMLLPATPTKTAKLKMLPARLPETSSTPRVVCRHLARVSESLTVRAPQRKLREPDVNVRAVVLRLVLLLAASVKVFRIVSRLKMLTRHVRTCLKRLGMRRKPSGRF